LTPKSKLRETLLSKRKCIPQERRKEASLAAFAHLKKRGRILSFSSMGSEIDLSILNNELKKSGCLFLASYPFDISIKNLFSQLDCILVPGLGFDNEFYRIGYGKGYYDRLLAITGNIPTIGIGFKEQLCEQLLPRDPWDMPVKELLLF
jgi:5-formyltetrahydrofolate cyclo-ligase